MANFPWTVTETLWISKYTLEYGSFTYGGVMSLATIWLIIAPEINWGDWIFFLAAAVPMSASFITLLLKKGFGGTEDSKYATYVKANWYYSFVAWCIGSFQVIV